jgi:hypothetical protein
LEESAAEKGLQALFKVSLAAVVMIAVVTDHVLISPRERNSK